MLCWRKDMTHYDAGNRRDIREAQKRAKVTEQQRREIITGIMSVEPGRRWMHDILEGCHIFSTSFSDAGLRMAFMEGQREVGLRLLMDIMGACPDRYIEMMRERNERQSSINARSERRDQDGDGRNQEPESDNDSGSDDFSDEYYDREAESRQPR